MSSPEYTQLRHFCPRLPCESPSCTSRPDLCFSFFFPLFFHQSLFIILASLSLSPPSPFPVYKPSGLVSRNRIVVVTFPLSGGSKYETACIRRALSATIVVIESLERMRGMRPGIVTRESDDILRESSSADARNPRGACRFRHGHVTDPLKIYSANITV